MCNGALVSEVDSSQDGSFFSCQLKVADFCKERNCYLELEIVLCAAAENLILIAGL